MICQQDYKGHEFCVIGENGILSRFTETLRNAEEEGETRIQDRARFVYNVKIRFKKKMENHRWEIPGLLVLISG